jgi:diguanylate cyclase (GGDEF)-like protein
LAYFGARRQQTEAPPRSAISFENLQRRLLRIGAIVIALTVPPLIWIDGLPALSVHGGPTALYSDVVNALSLGAVASIGVAYLMNRLNPLLDLWLAVANLSLVADMTLTRYSRPFAAGWYVSQLSILLAANAVLFVLMFQTANIYGQLAATAERLRNESLTDVLTGLANRRAFDQRFAEVLRECARERRPVSLLIIDVDHFKAYNDTFGHQAGDECLRVIALTLQHNIGRVRDLVARIGGEEMAVVLPEVDLPGAMIVADRMRAAVQSAAIESGAGAEHPLVTVSIGVIATRDPGATATHELVAAADRALYRAKAAGRNRVFEADSPS